MKSASKVFAVLSLAFVQYGHAAPGDLDVSFGTSPGFSAQTEHASTALTLVSGGRWIQAQRVPQSNVHVLRRYLSNGLIDSGFGANGVAQASSAFVVGIGEANVACNAQDVCFLTGVSMPSQAGSNYSAVLQVQGYSSQGTVYSGFGNAGFTSVPVSVSVAAKNNVRQSSLFANGYLYVATTSRHPTTQNQDVYLTRFLANGAVDTSFGNNGISYLRVYSDTGALNTPIKLRSLPDGRLLMLASVKAGSQNGYDAIVMRLLANGSVDSSFGQNNAGYVKLDLSDSDGARDLQIQSDGKLLVSLNALIAEGNRQPAVARLFANGAFDPSFGTAGVVRLSYNQNTQGYALALDAQNRAVLVGGMQIGSDIGTSAAFVLRLTSGGLLDTSFNGIGIKRYGASIGSSSYAAWNAVQIDAQGKIVLGGTTTVDSGLAASVLARVLP